MQALKNVYEGAHFTAVFNIPKKNSFTDLRVSVDTGKRLKMAVCDNLNPRIFMSFLLPTKERALCTSKDS